MKNDIEVLAEAVRNLQEQKKIYGVKGLSDYLKCSYATAQKISVSGLFRRYQVPGRRVIFFYEDEVIKAMAR